MPAYLMMWLRAVVLGAILALTIEAVCSADVDDQMPPPTLAFFMCCCGGGGVPWDSNCCAVRSPLPNTIFLSASVTYTFWIGPPASGHIGHRKVICSGTVGPITMTRQFGSFYNHPTAVTLCMFDSDGDGSLNAAMTLRFDVACFAVASVTTLHGPLAFPTGSFTGFTCDPIHTVGNSVFDGTDHGMVDSDGDGIDDTAAKNELTVDWEITE